MLCYLYYVYVAHLLYKTSELERIVIHADIQSREQLSDYIKQFSLDSHSTFPTETNPIKAAQPNPAVLASTIVQLSQLL